jgi:hypothetical protein
MNGTHPDGKNRNKAIDLYALEIRTRKNNLPI